MYAIYHFLTSDLYGELDVEDEDVAVDRILQNMMDKDLVQEEFFQDLGNSSLTLHMLRLLSSKAHKCKDF